MNFKLYHFILQVPKEHSAFLYFTLEASDGLGFYSTLDHQVGDSNRQIEIKGPIEFKDELKRLIVVLNKQFPIEIVLEEDIQDV